MNLHIKPILWLVGGIIVMFGLSLVLQLERSTGLLKKSSDASLTLLEQGEWKNAENVFLTTQNAVRGSLERGEMDKFIRLLQAQRGVKGLVELSLFNPMGVVTYSSDQHFLKKTMPDDVRSRLASSSERYIRKTDAAFEIYQPLAITPDCIRCHTKWKESDSGGTLFCRFSTEALSESKAVTASTLATMQSSQIKSGTVITLIIAGLFVVLAFMVVKYQIAAPVSMVLEKVSQTSHQLHDSSNQISTSSQSLASGASQQAASLQQTSASLEQLAAMTHRNSLHAQEAKDLATTARNYARAGTNDMSGMSRAMDDIKLAGNNIAKIVKSIDEIAFQTNILALNAAVEAARAGEAGAGFAVVADEVRNLAHRSALAARETAEKIEDCIVKSERGVQFSQKVVVHFEEIMTRVCKVDDLITHIAAASKEQSQGISQVNIAMSQMDQVTQSNAANAEQNAAAASELKAQSEMLKQALNKVVELMAGRNAAARQAEASALSEESSPSERRSIECLIDKPCTSMEDQRRPRMPDMDMIDIIRR